VIYVLCRELGYDGRPPIAAYRNKRDIAVATAALDAAYERYVVYVTDADSGALREVPASTPTKEQ
jgi:hypothetical protein